jgi:hypothetical protein
MPRLQTPRLLLIACLALPVATRAQDVPFTVAATPWDAELFGNHRAVVRVAGEGRFVQATLPWRRPDRNPEAKALIVTTADGRTVNNVRRGAITQAAGTIDFEPIAGAGRYYVYYLPFKSGGRSNYPNVTYLPVVNTADSSWLAAVAGANRPRATVERFEAVDSLNAFWPMLVVATDAERAQVEANAGASRMLVFPEDRMHPIMMRDQLPWRWARRGAGGALADTAARGEFVAFQMGVMNRSAGALENVHVTLGALKGPGGTIAASAFSSFNEGGIGWDAKPFTTRVDVPAGQVQAMWCGVDLPTTVAPGTYTGTVRVSAAGEREVTVPLSITVTKQVARASGADEPWKLTRLKWLNSTIAQANTVIRPYSPITVAGNTLRLHGREVTLAANGLPRSISTFFTPEMTGLQAKPVPVLRAPAAFTVQDGGGAPTAGGVRFTRREPGTVQWTASTKGAAWTLDVRGTLEFDGALAYEMVLRATKPLDARDIALVLPYAGSAATYAMGLGLKGQARPASFDWTWDVATKNQDGAWLGGVNAGLAFSLRAENYVRPLNTNFYLQKPLLLPPSWGNAGRGAISWREAGDTVMVRASSGARTLAAGDSLRFDVRFLITPFHALDTDAQWARRFYHRFAPLDSIQATGATVVNVHHATPINPWINYPFIAHDTMKAYIDAAHKRGMQVKIYNTVRELSNRAYETWPLRSLGHEVYSPGKGGGYAWLQEHLGDDYIAAWFVPAIKDAAIINSGMSRWHNYYAEGINWLVQRVGIDGLYLDDVAFDRTTMKRVRRLLTQDGHPGIIDLHSANQYNKNDGFINSAMLYMELFPYLDRLWFGEYFDYEANSADFYMAEVSGIPFGLMGEMLEKGGNPWRGMVYGMTNRMPWSDNADPRPLWRMWDAFGMKGSKMLGYWAPSVPVTTGRADVKATVYRQPGRALVSVASWATDTAKVALTVNWKALGIDPAKATITLPEVQGLQAARTLGAGEALVIAPNRGAFVIVR